MSDPIVALLVISSYMTALLIGAGIATFWWNRRANTVLDMLNKSLEREQDWSDLVEELEAEREARKAKLIENGIEVD